jgi:hypothetical protein
MCEKARRIKGATASAVASSDASFTLNNPVPIDDGMSPLTGSDTSITATNTGWKLAAGATVYCEFDSTVGGGSNVEGGYRIYDGPWTC